MRLLPDRDALATTGRPVTEAGKVVTSGEGTVMKQSVSLAVLEPLREPLNVPTSGATVDLWVAGYQCVL